ncbi:MAG TPA: beta-ketoacyl synthase N-terminal-like domain-containing protein [Steroidobacteraceae bacterium]|nr:beta-ketoacyl synthase N-terminal-like domain-containing protein [Steroidobacteraceae bacterium]
MSAKENWPNADVAGDALSPVKRALIEVRELRRRLAAYEAERHEPIAIVGIGCRLPGGIVDANGLWQLLSGAVDAVTEVPSSRWDADRLFDADPDAAGKMYTRAGAFVADVDRFDPYFFGIPPREAACMDPQQRLLLEVAWEALEDAGCDPSRLAGSDSGIFVGIGSHDYALLQARANALADIDAYFASGTTHSVAAGRLAYFLGFHGPCVAVDTACSSSLVAIHQACVSLRRRECRLALAGGASLMLTPDYTVNFCRARMLSPDGKCRTFDAGANGYVRGEGVALIALKRLTDAQAAGDRVLAVIRGSAVNQDGRSTGLTVPNGPAQSAVIQSALADAQLEPRDVKYVEAHGTGTPLGDPIEVQALAASLGAGRSSDSPLLIGSIKTNIGHLESAAGIAGLLKVVLSMQHGEIPAHLHLTTPNPHIDWARLPVAVTTTRRPWPEGRKIAGVSSFGFSGTNAHVILEEAPPATAVPSANAMSSVSALPSANAPGALCVLPLSAKDGRALKALATRYEAHLASNPDANLADVCYTAATGRAHFNERAAIVAADIAAARTELGNFLRGFPSARLHSGSAPVAPQIAFLFTGQGAQYAGMGRELYESEPVFREVLDRCAQALAGELDRPLLEVMWGAESAHLDQTRYTQPALYALEVAVATLWRSWGVEPSVVLGHSVGEYAAACVAGAFTVEEGARLVAARARLMQQLPAGGGMLAVQGASDRVQELVEHTLSGRKGGVGIAALNAPGSIVLSGAQSALKSVAQDLADAGLRVTPLQVSHAFHSELLDPMLDEYERVAGAVQHSAPQMRWISNLSGDELDWDRWSGSMGRYWREHARQAVKFESSVRAAARAGAQLFIEVGPHGVLATLGQTTLGADTLGWVASLRRGRGEREQLLESVAQVYVRGVALDWQRFAGSNRHRKVALPTYPFQRERYWVTLTQKRESLKEHTPRWKRALAAGRRHAEFMPVDMDIDSFPAKFAALEKLSLAYMRETLRQLQLFVRAGEVHTASGIIERAGIQPVYLRLIERWLAHLAAAGLLESRGEEYVATSPLPHGDLEQVRSAARDALRGYSEMFDFVDLCGSKLADVLCGRESALETLFPSGSSHIADGIYQHSVVARYYNEIVRSVVQAIAGDAQSLSILEIGAGTGGTTSLLLPTLDPARCRYVFTDVGKLFLVQARKKFSEHKFLEYAVLNIEQSPAEQGFAEHAFDVVVAADVLHATSDLAKTLQHVRSLLAPGGVLVMLEATDDPIWLDVSIGLVRGWQKFADPMREKQPLLKPEQWSSLLLECGFDAVEAFPSANARTAQLGHHVIIAKPQGSAATSSARASGRLVDAELALAAEDRASDTTPLRSQLDAAPPHVQMEMLIALVSGEVAAVLGLDAAHHPAPEQRLMDFGVDSLMAVELRNRLARRLALTRKLTATLIFDYPTVSAIAKHLATDVLRYAPHAREEDSRSAPAPAAVRATTAAQIEQMAEEEAEAMLLEKLSRL